MAAPNQQKPALASLVNLQPQNSGLLWNQMTSGTTMLLPVSQPVNQARNDAESDSFVGQSSPRPPPSSFQPIHSGPAAPANVAGPMSQLQQPLRPVQQRSSPSPSQTIAQDTTDTQRSTTPATTTTTNVPFQEIVDYNNMPPMQSTFAPRSAAESPPEALPSHARPPSYATASMMGPPASNIGGPPSAAPPTGPYQSFRRQGPLQHTFAPTPGLSNPRGTSESPPPPYYQPYQVPAYQPPQQPLVPGPYQAPGYSPATGADNAQKGPEQPTLVLGASDDSFHPVQCHWFYRKEVEKKHLWLPFSLVDSLALEDAFKRGDSDAVVTTDGGRYDVVVGERLRHAVYWEEEPTPVKRSSWFFKADGQNRFVPYDEDLAHRIEEHYQDAVLNHRLHHRLELPGHECIVVHNAQLVAHYQPSKHTDEWGTIVDGQMRTRMVKRGIDEILKVDEGESTRIDHLVFLVHGVGAVCDLRFRSLVECVDDFRSMGLSLMKTHFKSSIDEGRAGRVEFLPVSWHSKLHGDATGIDKRMQNITLSSIPKLRHFTNDTLMDIFFYTSPVYCQTIVDTVGSEVNRLYQTFLQRNPNFNGRVSLVGHSLGALIVFDILSHQLGQEPTCSPLQDPLLPPAQSQEDSEKEDPVSDTLDSLFKTLDLEEYTSRFEEEKLDIPTLKMCSDSDLKELGLPLGSRRKLMTYLNELDDKLSKVQQKEPAQTVSESSSTLGIPCSDSKMSLLNRQESVTSVNYMVGVAGTGQPSVVYPKLAFEPACFFGLGSPIAMFLTVRGIQTIGEDYHLPTCLSFFNIFHPFDPVAYRMETLIDPELTIKPVLVPHHKGRKRMHLELRDSLSRMGTDLKQRLMDSLRNTWHSLSEFARAHRSSQEQLEAEMDRVVNEELKAHQPDIDDTESNVSGADFAPQEDIQIGQLNGGRRIDYVLQEKPIESFNEYLFALASHACYWESEDTVLMILKEVYQLDGVLPHSPHPHLVPKMGPYSSSASHVPFNENPFSLNGARNNGGGMVASVPPTTNSSHPLGPPPLSGFVKVPSMPTR